MPARSSWPDCSSQSLPGSCSPPCLCSRHRLGNTSWSLCSNSPEGSILLLDRSILMMKSCCPFSKLCCTCSHVPSSELQP